MTGHNKWPPAWVGVLEQGVAAGKSAANIAEIMTTTFGGQFTRSQITGRCRRTGLKLTGRVPAAGPSHAARPRPPQPRATVDFIAPPPALVESPGAAAPVEIENDQPDIFAGEEPVTLGFGAGEAVFGLRLNSCRWPIGDPTKSDFRFCGETRLDLRPYCAAHAALAYAPSQPRRDKMRPRV